VSENHADTLDKLLASGGDLGQIAGRLQGSRGLPSRIEADPERLERGLAQLVLTLIELLRQLMERQAIARMEQGTLTDDEVERLGETFMKLAERMDELKEHFEFEDSDLNLNLGPLGNLL
jgi:Gas vesicle protein K